MTSIDRLRELGAERVHGDTISLREKPLWEGPNSSEPNGGITFSTLSRFLVCRERFRLYIMEGLRSEDKFNHKLEYGNMWHLCEEAYRNLPAAYDSALYWKDSLQRYGVELCKKYPFDQYQIDHWYNVLLVQFPIYVDYWRQHSEKGMITPLLREKVFDVPYSLPSGRAVRLRGKWDGVDLVDGENGSSAVWLCEHKTKGDIKESQIKRQLKYDLQTMLYLAALKEWQDLDDYGIPIRTSDLVDNRVGGVKYNVVKRPLSGGKGTIVRKKGTKKVAPETKEHYYQRLSDIIKADPQSYFMRWNVAVTTKDIERFRTECLDPVLESLVDWYDWVKNNSNPFRGPSHWRSPFGVSGSIDQYESEYDEYLDSGSMVGLRRVDKLFEELT